MKKVDGVLTTNHKKMSFHTLMFRTLISEELGLANQKLK